VVVQLVCFSLLYTGFFHGLDISQTGQACTAVGWSFAVINICFGLFVLCRIGGSAEYSSFTTQN
jgi:hypothetical protein